MIQYTREKPLRCFYAFAGYNSQKMALQRLAENFPGFHHVCVGWSEIDKNAIIANNAVFPEDTDKNFGDITKIDWAKVPDFDLFTMSSPCFVKGTLVLTSEIEGVTEETAQRLNKILGQFSETLEKCKNGQ